MTKIRWYTQLGDLADCLTRPKATTSPASASSAIDPARVTFVIEAVGLAKGEAVQLGAQCRRFDEHLRFAGGQGFLAQDGSARFEFTLNVPDPRLWTPETPNLYAATLELRDDKKKAIDRVETYFGLRTIGRGRYGDEPFERILLNGKPLYLRAALDQSFNPKGLYTALRRRVPQRGTWRSPDRWG